MYVLGLVATKVEPKYIWHIGLGLSILRKKYVKFEIHSPMAPKVGLAGVARVGLTFGKRPLRHRAPCPCVCPVGARLRGRGDSPHGGHDGQLLLGAESTRRPIPEKNYNEHKTHNRDWRLNNLYSEYKHNMYSHEQVVSLFWLKVDVYYFVSCISIFF